MRQLKSNGVVLRLAKYTWMSAWLKYYNVISLVAQKDNGRRNQGTKMLTYRRGLFDVINALAREPSNHLSRVFSRKVYLNRIAEDIISAENRIPQNLSADTKWRTLAKAVLPHILRGVAQTTRISFGLIMHLISARLQQLPAKVTMFETTAELLQCIVLQLISPCSNRRLFSGDLHTCQLHCTRCGRCFGVIDTLDVVLANAQFAILKHHGLCVVHWEKVSSEERDLPSDGDETDLSCYGTRDEKLHFLFENVLPPIFASVSNLDEAMKQWQRNLDQATKQRQPNRLIARCKYGNHDTPSDKDERHKNFMHNCVLTEAVNMDAGYFLSDVTASNARVYATSAILGGFFQTMVDAHDLYQKVQVGESKDEEWENYYERARQPERAAEIASELDKLEEITYKGVKDFCELLDALFMNNMALALSPAPDGAEMDDDFRSYLQFFWAYLTNTRPILLAMRST